MILFGQEVIATCHGVETMTNYAQLANGHLAKQRVGDDWVVYKKWKDHVPPEEYATRFDKQFKEGRVIPGLVDHPTSAQLMKWEFDGMSEATDGCQVEPDGVCPHQCKSWITYFI